MNHKYIDITDKRFGQLVAKNLAGKNTRGELLWLCICDCGNEKITTGIRLRRGDTKSCGCFSKKIITNIGKEAWVKGYTKAGETRKRASIALMRKYGYEIMISKTREYRSWTHAKQRCSNPKYPWYHRYGKRGIKMCDRWENSFEMFLSDMGKCPTGFSLERINNDGNYEPENCKWATAKEQALNRDHSRIKFNLPSFKALQSKV